MNRTDRLLAIVLELQARGRRRAEDLAARFETSKRTIYRDVQALSESGVPVVAEPGKGYSLVEGYFLPPVSFTADEATLLLLGADFMAQNFDAEYKEAARAAASKIEAVLPERQRSQVARLQRSLKFISAPPAGGGQAETLARIRRAILQSCVVRFDYHTRHRGGAGGERNARESEPYALVYYQRHWYLVAWCRLRRDLRHFRLDRIDHLEITGETFVPSPAFSLGADRLEEPAVTVRFALSPEIERWVREEQSYSLVRLERECEDLVATLRVHREEDVFHWLLGWGLQVRVLEPESLRQRVIEEIRALEKIYETAPALLP